LDGHERVIKKEVFLLAPDVIVPTKPCMVDFESQKKLGVLELAEQLGNVSEASHLSGASRDTICRASVDQGRWHRSPQTPGEREYMHGNQVVC